MFRVTTLDVNDPPRCEDGSVDYSKDFFGQEVSLTVSGQMEGERYEAFDTAEHRVRYDEDGSRDNWWVQSSFAGSASYFCLVNTHGLPYNTSASLTWVGAPLCFCL